MRNCVATIAGTLLALLFPMVAGAAGASAASDRENPTSSIPYESGQKDELPPYEERWSDFLPIFGRAAREQGYVLPRPFGASAGLMFQDQPFEVNGVSVEGIDVVGPGLVALDTVQNQERTVTARFDVWLFPFFNFYGILGQTSGDASGPMVIDLNPVAPSLPPVIGLICQVNPEACRIDTRFDIVYEGFVRGGGLTIAGGYQDFFGMIDSNITYTDLDISTTDARAIVTSARLGWNGKLGNFTGALWVGAMYQDINQTLDLEIPVQGEILHVSVEQKTEAPWNAILGGRWELAHGFETLAEVGIGERKSFMLNLTYRF